MFGKVIDINSTEAFVTLQDGTILEVGLCHLPNKIKLGDNVDLNLNCSNMQNDRMNTFY